MNRAHLLGSQFGGTGGRQNIVILWKGVNQYGGAMYTWEGRVIQPALAQGQRVLYYAQAVYSPLPGSGIQPYMPIGVYVSWQISGGPPRTDFFANVP